MQLKRTESERFKNDFWDSDDIPFIKDAQANIFCKVDETLSISYSYNCYC